ncbi:putative membrane protein [Salinibacterium sp. CAN_S4]|uniref:DoxX family protein n=1 Tax=Salinibacterium sp. CAN_S4 TaxID=2787727 RepID=UPI0018F04109
MTNEPETTPTRNSSLGRTIGRVLLGLFLVGAGVGHLTVARQGFQTQVPPWLPFDVDFVVVASGIVEITLGLAVLLLRRYRVAVGWIVALFFLAIFPGNISQLFVHTAAEGWDNTTAIVLGVRLLFQPLLVAWALWSTGAWKWWRARRS